MKKGILLLSFLLASLLLGAPSAIGITIGVFDNGSYVDTSGGSGSESDTIQASLLSLGFSVSTFTGFAASDWTAAAAAADVILIPELERADLGVALDASARTAIQNAVSSGTGFISICDYYLILNDVFGYSLTRQTAGTTNLNVGNASGTVFSGGPASIPYLSYTIGMNLANLPSGAVSFYDDGSYSTVFASGYGSGMVGSLGWDWFNAAPLGSADSGWINVLDSMVQYTAGGTDTPVPEPSTMLLLGVGLIGIAGATRRKLKR